MGTETSRLGLYKPTLTEQYDLNHWNGNTDIIEDALGDIIDDYADDKRHNLREWNQNYKYIENDLVLYVPDENELTAIYDFGTLKDKSINSSNGVVSKSNIYVFKCIKNTTSSNVKPIIFDSITNKYEINSEYWTVDLVTSTLSRGSLLSVINHALSESNYSFVLTKNSNESSSDSSLEMLYSTDYSAVSKTPYMDKNFNVFIPYGSLYGKSIFADYVQTPSIIADRIKTRYNSSNVDVSGVTYSEDDSPSKSVGRLDLSYNSTTQVLNITVNTYED